jgi:peptide deformylase
MPAPKPFKPQLPVDLYALTEGDKARLGAEQRLGMLAAQAPILTQVCAEVQPETMASAAVQEIVGRLMKVAAGQQAGDAKDKKRRMLVGLAAPQIGEPLRIIVVDTKIRSGRKRPGRLECFINPEIIWRSRETAEGREGCFSAGPVWGLVRRSVAVKIRAFTPDGKKVERVFEDFTARIFQHEIDHLNGIRFPERIKTDRKRHWVHAEEQADYPRHIHYWPRICTWQQWVVLITP